MRHRRLLGLVVALGLIGTVVVAAAPAEADTALPVVFSMSSSLPSQDPFGRQLFVERSTVADDLLTVNQLSLALTETAPDSAAIHFAVYPPSGSTFRQTSYTHVQRGQGSDPKLATMDMSIDGSELSPANGDVWFNDLQTDSTGHITRLDLIYRYDTDRIVNSVWGELRIGEPVPAGYQVSTANIEWPAMPIGATNRDATEWVTNTGASPIDVGTPTIDGVEPAVQDFSIERNGCSAPLAPGDSCPIVIVVSPPRGGSHGAGLHLPFAGSGDVATLRDLSWTPSQFTTSGNDYVDQGKTLTETDGAAEQITEITSPSEGRIQFAAAMFDGSVNDHFVLIDAGSDGKLTGGVHQVPGGGSRTGWEVVVGAGGRGCNDITGTVDVRQLLFNTDGTLAAADIGLNLICHSSTDAPMTGQIYWRSSATSGTGTVTFGLAAVPVRTVVPISGFTEPGGTAQVYFRQRGTTSYVLRRTLNADARGNWATSFTPIDDYAYYVTEPGYTSVVYRTQIAPVIAGPQDVLITRNHIETLTGTGTPGATVQLRFHRPGLASSTDVLRTVSVDSRGNWTRPYVAAVTYAVSARSSANGLTTPATTVTVQG